MKTYVLTARRYPWLLPLVEASIRGLTQEPVRGFSRLLRGLRTLGGRPVSDDEALLALNALCDLGVLERIGLGYRLNKQQFDATEGLRDGIHTALAIMGESFPDSPPEAQLCVSLPPSLPAASEHVIREASADLRSSLIDVVAGAKHSLIVASPFWDAGTAGEMASLLDKRLSTGVRVWLLGRFERDLPLESDRSFEGLPARRSAPFSLGLRDRALTSRHFISRLQARTKENEATWGVQT